MTSFQISDPPSKAVLNETAGAKGIYGALITFSVENLTALNRTATVNIIPAAEEERVWYKFTGASATNPTVSTVDFGPREVRTIEVAVTVPAGTTPKTSSLSLRVALESKPEDDAVDSRPVALTVPALPPIPPVPKQLFPWWAVAIAVCLVLLVGGGLTYALWPKPNKNPPPPVQGFALRCKGGPTMQVVDANDNSIKISFVPTTQGFGAITPLAGQCGWEDRGFRPGEPNVLLVASEVVGSDKLRDMVRAGSVINVIAYNDAHGAMVVTKINR